MGCPLGKELLCLCQGGSEFVLCGCKSPTCQFCLQTLQRSLEGDQPIAVQIVGRHNLRDATARLIDVETFIEFGVSSARARAALSNPTGLELNDDTVVVRLQCR